MAKGGSSSSTTQQTSNIYTDQSASAAEGGMAVGAGAQVKIESVEAAKASVEATRDVAGMALAAQQNVSGAALKTTENVTIKALDTGAALAMGTINTVAGLAEVASRERQDVLQTTNYALQSQQGVTEKLAALASGALERSQTPESQTTKTLLWVVGIVAVAVALILGFALRTRTAPART